MPATLSSFFEEVLLSALFFFVAYLCLCYWRQILQAMGEILYYLIRNLDPNYSPTSSTKDNDDEVWVGSTIEEPNEDGDIPRSTRIKLSLESRRKHIYVLGATGTGKSTLMLRLIASDIAQRRTFCVVDLGGELVDHVLMLLAEESDESWLERLTLVDLRQSDYVVGFNPLAGQELDRQRAMLLHSVIKQQSESWGVTIERTLRNCLMALSETGWSLLEVEPMLENAGFRAEVLSQVKNRRVKHFFEDFNKLSPAEQRQRTEPVINRIDTLLSVPQLQLMFGQRESFSFAELFDERPGSIVLIALAGQQLEEAAKLAGGLFVSCIQSTIMARGTQPEEERVPVHLYVDEFATMAAERFERIISEARKFGLGLCLAHQHLYQLSVDLMRTLRNVVQNQFYFQTGALDASELAQEISMDKTTSEIKSLIMSQRVGEAFLVRRGKRSRRLEIRRSRHAEVDLSVVQAIRDVALASRGRPFAEVEQEIIDRETYIASLEKPKSQARESVTNYEIHHDKLPHFRPKLDPSDPAAEGTQ